LLHDIISLGTWVLCRVEMVLSPRKVHPTVDALGAKRGIAHSIRTSQTNDPVGPVNSGSIRGNRLNMRSGCVLPFTASPVVYGVNRWYCDHQTHS
jgi:hypothetical protein